MAAIASGGFKLKHVASTEVAVSAGKKEAAAGGKEGSLAATLASALANRRGAQESDSESDSDWDDD